MKYYQVSFDVETTGLKNSIYQIVIDKNSMQQNNDFYEFLTFFNTKNKEFWDNQKRIQTIKIPKIEARLLKNAKVTDIMGYTQNIPFLDLIYSEKFINILKAFNIGNYTTFEVEVENVKEKYYMLFTETILSKKIFFEYSLVYTGHKVLKNIKYFNFSNYDDYWLFKQNNPLAKFQKITISKEYYNRDIIDIQTSSLPFYSEKLIDFLLDCGITGLQVSYKNSIQLEFV
jgi:hypothetical protein